MEIVSSAVSEQVLKPTFCLEVHEPLTTTSFLPLPQANHSITKTQASSALSFQSRLSFQKDQKHYCRRVSFDNAADQRKSEQTFTLSFTTERFSPSHRSRCFLLPIDLDVGTTDAIQYAMEASYQSSTGQLDRPISERIYTPPKKIAQDIRVTIELHFGRPETSLIHMAAMYEPSVIVLGTRNRPRQKTPFSGAGVFKYSLRQVRIPVIVVRDSQDRMKETESQVQSIASFHFLQFLSPRRLLKQLRQQVHAFHNTTPLA
ncbi:hypothetical protein PHYBLDRAFT_148040 [Phycomyces blakesleeanus NRRL 1555(-)]|uniref:Uncharacterized protein n=1 Tax=Phycomyces blakesleeanus (strain ATCC 8743b / DSM 1359 / FGSC 10004 / NBRC 33097 / NRRL 1555) TaxID=763407 RepID=A0A167LNX6_PHYB8|nr:hypothetical protein PHYBLDRAFT_148040 [Phycomyces blakesleeanus NRRL 1555(-)]OAD70819.1 hypothetical protein PHYBLDRAFT_148040 [Phycomyces blakesleeanus NRRL 1555(-)]|eukprot:XP_018288859.1 hypothetical protein PHYBLDRAFT_148040 [Phycomyces blakesleeanus NRRL 1555(-)]